MKRVKESDAFLKQIMHKYLMCMNTDERHRLVRYSRLSDNRLEMSSSCSGSELVLFIMHLYADMLGATLEHVFSCEKVIWKQDWIRHNVEAYVYVDQSRGHRRYYYHYYYYYYYFITTTISYYYYYYYYY